MEEKKAKEVKMTANNSNNKTQKLTYEQLNEACNQLFQQNQKLLMQIREINMANSFRRLDYLFKVVEYADTFKDADFVNSCIDEIKEAMTPVDNNEPEAENKED